MQKENRSAVIAAIANLARCLGGLNFEGKITNLEHHYLMTQVFNIQAAMYKDNPPKVLQEITANMQDIPPEFAEVLDKHFWDLI